MSSTLALLFSICCRVSQMSFCTKTEWTLPLEPHSRMQASRKSSKFVVPPPFTFMILCSTSVGTLRLMENALMISLVFGESSSSWISSREMSPERSTSAPLKTACMVVRNCSDSATKALICWSCSLATCMILSTMTPTMRLTRQKLVRTMTTTQYNPHSRLYLMAHRQTLPQSSSVAIWKWVYMHLASDPNLSSTSGSLAAYGCPNIITTKTEPTYMTMKRSSDSHPTALIDLMMVVTRIDSSLNIRSTRMRRTRRTSLRIRRTFTDLNEESCFSFTSVMTQVSTTLMIVTTRSKTPQRSK
mmetsp:Transcript_17670/g.46635  ORF Transcript_17670/g.46635 Transcript_17670/m.46635 type:complete len:301 (-) Transcript_17670:401-1303(-)